MASPSVSPQLCPECGAALKPDAANCWLCKAPVAVLAELVEPLPPPVVPQWLGEQRKASPAQFSLETLMLVITLVAVCLGMIVAAPGLGVLVSIVAAPALIRTLIVGRQERAAGSRLTLAEKVLTFLASAGVTLAVLATGFSAFAAACFASCLVVVGASNLTNGQRLIEPLIYVFLAVSALVGLIAASWMFWLLRPRRQ